MHVSVTLTAQSCVQFLTSPVCVPEADWLWGEGLEGGIREGEARVGKSSIFCFLRECKVVL